jgi:hypothetical protein
LRCECLTWGPRRLVEGLGDGLLDLLLQLPVVLNALLAFPSNLFTDALRGGPTVDPSGPAVVGPVQVFGILLTATGWLAALGVRS